MPVPHPITARSIFFNYPLLIWGGSEPSQSSLHWNCLATGTCNTHPQPAKYPQRNEWRALYLRESLSAPSGHLQDSASSARSRLSPSASPSLAFPVLEDPSLRRRAAAPDTSSASPVYFGPKSFHLPLSSSCPSGFFTSYDLGSGFPDDRLSTPITKTKDERTTRIEGSQEKENPDA